MPINFERAIQKTRREPAFDYYDLRVSDLNVLLNMFYEQDARNGIFDVIRARYAAGICAGNHCTLNWNLKRL